MPIDFSKLPRPDVIEQLDFETILQSRKSRLLELKPDAADVIDNESEPLNILLQEQAYRELLLRQRINDSALAMTLAYAHLGDLDYIGNSDRYRMPRLVLTPEDTSTNPVTPAVMESDSSYRNRLYLSQDALSTAGPKEMYEAIARSADSDVADAKAVTPSDGRVEIYITSHSNNGNADTDLTNIVNAACSADRARPMTDYVSCSASSVSPVFLVAELTMSDDVDAAGEAEVLANSQAAIDALKSERIIGEVLAVSRLYAALHVSGVRNVNLITPTENVDPGETGVVVLMNASLSVYNDSAPVPF